MKEENYLKISYLSNLEKSQQIYEIVQTLPFDIEIIKNSTITQYLEQNLEDNQKEIKELSLEKLKEAEDKLRDKDWNIREEAALHLAITRDSQSIPLLLDYIDDPVSEVKQMIIYALGTIKNRDKKVLDALIYCLQDQDFDVRKTTVEALAKIGSPSTLDPLLTCVTAEKDWCVQEAIALAFSRIQIQDNQQKGLVIKALENLQNNDNIFVAEAASYALAQIPQPQPSVIVNLSDWLKNNIFTPGWQLYTELFGNSSDSQVPAYCGDNTEIKEKVACKRCKRIEEFEEKGQFIALIVRIQKKLEQNENDIVVELKPYNDQEFLPVGLKFLISFESEEEIIEYEIQETDNEKERKVISQAFFEEIGKSLNFDVKVIYQDITFTEYFAV